MIHYDLLGEKIERLKHESSRASPDLFIKLQTFKLGGGHFANERVIVSAYLSLGIFDQVNTVDM